MGHGAELADESPSRTCKKMDDAARRHRAPSSRSGTCRKRSSQAAGGRLRGAKRLGMAHGAVIAFAVVVVALAAANQAQLGSCISNQQQQQQQQQLTEQNSIGQAYGSGGGGADYSLISDAANLLNLGRPVLAGNSKRARKMSAFMPMRGRKDGRDGQQQQLFALDESLDGASPIELLIGAGPFRETDASDSSILRLVQSAASGAGAGLQQATHWGSPVGTPATPLQFANQLVAHHPMMMRSASGQRLSASSPLDSSGLVEGSSGPQFELVMGGEGGDGPAPMMQAKLRRAFHPMRGKKSVGQQQFAAELAYPDDTQTDV